MKRVHFLIRYRGQIVGDVLLPEDATDAGARTPSVDPAFAALWTGYREALDAGTATVDRKGSVDGRDVYWLRFPGNGHGRRTEVAVDAETYKPVIFRDQLSELRRLDQRVLVAETVAFAPEQFARIAPGRGLDLWAAGSGSSFSWGEDEQPDPAVRSPWLTPGERVAGLKLFAVSPLTVDTEDGKTSEGIVLLYKSPGSSPDPSNPFDQPEMTIEQTARADDPRAWSQIPAGSVAIQTGETTSGSQETHSTWTGTLVKNGIYVTIETQRDEATVLAVARALQAAP
jgi:hypothetical protein